MSGKKKTRSANKARDDRRFNAKVFLELAIVFGAKCQMCEETDPVTFEWHHVEGGGTKERREKNFPQSRRFALNASRSLKRPADGYMLLCLNCHAKVHRSVTAERKLPIGRITKILKLTKKQVAELGENGAIGFSMEKNGWGKDEMVFTPESVIKYVFEQSGRVEEIQKHILTRHEK